TKVAKFFKKETIVTTVSTVSTVSNNFLQSFVNHCIILILQNRFSIVASVPQAHSGIIGFGIEFCRVFLYGLHKKRIVSVRILRKGNGTDYHKMKNFIFQGNKLRVPFQF